jgi:hypothetical protein
MPKSRYRKKRKASLPPGVVRMTPEVHAAMKEQREVFRKKFGRDPGPDDPVIFDPLADTPVPYPKGKMEEEVVEAMRKAGIRSEIIYAYKKTGLLLMADTPASKRDRKEWNDAIAEYLELERKAGRDSDAS